MLDKQLARELIPLVNDLEKFALLEEYIHFRQGYLKDQLMQNTPDWETAVRIQGQYSELEILKNLKKYVDTDKV